MTEFLNMGGYGQYVWTSYALSAVAIVGLSLAIWRRGKTLREKLRQLERSANDVDQNTHS